MFWVAFSGDVCDLDASILLVVHSRRHGHHDHHHHDHHHHGGPRLNRAHRVRWVASDEDSDGKATSVEHVRRLGVRCWPTTTRTPATRAANTPLVATRTFRTWDFGFFFSPLLVFQTCFRLSTFLPYPTLPGLRLTSRVLTLNEFCCADHLISYPGRYSSLLAAVPPLRCFSGLFF